MSYLTAALLGLVQGITEFLPVSGSGHLALLQNIFHMDEVDQMFRAMLYLGTLIAVFLTYKNDVKALFRGGFGLLGIGRDARSRKPKAQARRRMAMFIIIGTLPLIVMLLFRKKLAQLGGNTVFVGCMLLLNGLVLYLSDRNSRNTRELKHITLVDAILVGLGQALAVVPGISRTGTTTSVGMLRGFQRTFAVKYSLLLSIPAVMGGAVLAIVDAVRGGFASGLLPVYLIGLIVSAVSGYFSIRLLRWVAARGRFSGFAYYCWGAGIVALLLSLVA